MKDNTVGFRSRRGAGTGVSPSLSAKMRRMIVGQDEALDAILPYIDLFEASLAPQGRPAGIFLLLGPTGTGKTRTVEALAEALHGSERNVLRVDCGEFQLDHEVAKLIGAPPGYLGHRETHPLLTQQKLNAVTSQQSDLSLVLFDEIEKAAPSMARLLLGVMDKATLKLGDNTVVNFQSSLIFMTSNLGAREMAKAAAERFGFASLTGGAAAAEKLSRIGLNAVKRRFSPEFVNRIDRTITYHPLERECFDKILDLQIQGLENMIAERFAEDAFSVKLTAAARNFLLERGTSKEYGARELKRVIHRHVIQPLAQAVLRDLIEPGGAVRFDVSADGSSLRAISRGGRPLAA
ncbi:MAG: ATP-dependent Clp protease ATP-binding subunit [Bryobacteraceae bacterium]|nr:ATP-dependent Clp protease ATP-binding subunit [Bryobacteraceae bacterium]